MAKKQDTIYISVDIGYDTTKSAYAYEEGDNKFVHDIIDFGEEGFPSLAYYNVQDSTWQFGTEVYGVAKSSFKYIVKIKELLDLITYENGVYYEKYKYFPTFEFPVDNKIKNNFREVINRGKVFEANITPREVCDLFLRKYLEEVYKKLGDERNNKKFVGVYPGGASKIYIEELRRLISVCSDTKGVVMISAPKAVGVCAKDYKVFVKANGKEHENVLLFNVGAGNTSVARLRISNKNIAVDSIEAHSEPIDFGGNDFDGLINDMVMAESAKIPAFGTVSDGSNKGVRIVEKGTYYQQFMLMKSIKCNKKMFAKEDNAIFTMERELRVFVNIDRNDFVDKSKEELYSRMWEYVKGELLNTNNKDVTAVVLSGGAADTYHLDKYISERLANLTEKPGVEFIDFSPFDKNANCDRVLCDPRYTAAIGAALFAVGKYEMEIVTTLSYGTYYIIYKKGNDLSRIGFSLLIPKGTKIKLDGGSDKAIYAKNSKGEEEAIPWCSCYAKEVLVNGKKEKKYTLYNEYYSIGADEKQIEEINKTGIATFPGSSVSEYLAKISKGKVVDSIREKLKRQYGFKTVLSSDIYFSVDISNLPNRQLLIVEGFILDIEGRAVPTLKNASAPGSLASAVDVSIDYSGTIEV